MVAYQQAILSAKEQNIWKPHPNFKRKNQVVSLVEGMGMYWDSDTSVIIPGLSEPPVRTLRATIPENESHIFR